MSQLKLIVLIKISIRSYILSNHQSFESCALIKMQTLSHSLVKNLSRGFQKGEPSKLYTENHTKLNPKRKIMNPINQSIVDDSSWIFITNIWPHNTAQVEIPARWISCNTNHYVARRHAFTIVVSLTRYKNETMYAYLFFPLSRISHWSSWKYSKFVWDVSQFTILILLWAITTSQLLNTDHAPG